MKTHRRLTIVGKLAATLFARSPFNYMYRNFIFNLSTHKSTRARNEAGKLMRELAPCPVYMDGFDNEATRLYSAFPTSWRLYSTVESFISILSCTLYISFKFSHLTTCPGQISPDYIYRRHEPPIYYPRKSTTNRFECTMTLVVNASLWQPWVLRIFSYCLTVLHMFGHVDMWSVYVICVTMSLFRHSSTGTTFLFFF